VKPSSFRVLVAATLALPAVALGHSPRASACENEVIYQVSPDIQQITASELALGAGRAAKAVEGLLRRFPKARAEAKLPDRGPGMGIDKTGARAQRLVAVAIVRTEGLLAVGEAYPSATAGDRRANLEWSIGILRAFAKVSDGPSVQTDLGEALSKLPETRGEALTILDGLARKDLVTSPQGYAALADLRLAAGDRAGYEAARKKYERMAPASAPAAARVLISTEKG
jgi:hypothetical protein